MAADSPKVTYLPVFASIRAPWPDLCGLTSSRLSQQLLDWAVDAGGCINRYPGQPRPHPNTLVHRNPRSQLADQW